MTGWGVLGLRTGAATALMAAGLWFAKRGVVWTDLVWTWRAAGALGIVAGAAVIYFGVLFVTGWRLSDLRPKR